MASNDSVIKQAIVKIKVFGVGGGGNSVLLRMAKDNELGIELIESAEPDEHPDVLPGAVPLDEAGAGIEAVEMEHLVVPPGGNATVTLTRATHLRIREIPMSEAVDG